MAIEEIGGKAPDGLRINNHAIEFLGETAKWAKFLSIVGFIGIGLLIVFAFFAQAFASTLADSESVTFSVDGGIYVTIIYLILAVIYFFPVYYLYKFSNNMKKALQTKDEDLLSSAFEMLKSHYKFIGILTIVGVSFYILIFFIAIAVALSA